jgi:hypothetical protein
MKEVYPSHTCMCRPTESSFTLQIRQAAEEHIPRTCLPLSMVWPALPGLSVGAQQAGRPRADDCKVANGADLPGAVRLEPAPRTTTAPLIS